MILDDRPVIDQLPNPTPLNHLYEAADELSDWMYDKEEANGLQWVSGASAMLKMVVTALEARL